MKNVIAIKNCTLISESYAHETYLLNDEDGTKIVVEFSTESDEKEIHKIIPYSEAIENWVAHALTREMAAKMAMPNRWDATEWLLAPGDDILWLAQRYGVTEDMAESKWDEIERKMKEEGYSQKTELTNIRKAIQVLVDGLKKTKEETEEE